MSTAHRYSRHCLEIWLHFPKADKYHCNVPLIRQFQVHTDFKRSYLVLTPWFSIGAAAMQCHAKVTWLHWDLSEVVMSVEQRALADLSVIHLAEMWHTVGGLCLWSISANKKQPSLSGLPCPPACSLVSAVNPCLKGAGDCVALSDAPQMAFQSKPQ